MRLLQILLHEAPVLTSHVVALNIAPRAAGALIERGARVHAVGHAGRINMA